MIQSKQKKAFTLLEVIMVIVILGIVSSIGSSIIAQLYENYIVQRAMHRVSLKTELAINQIVNRLTYRIDSSVVTRNGTTLTPLSDVSYQVFDDTNTILEWIGYDNDSFSAKINTTGWSGYCDRNLSTVPNLITPGSTLSTTTSIVQNLSGNNTMPPLAVLFSLAGSDGNISGATNPALGPECYGYTGNRSCIHNVTITNNIQLRTNRLSGGQTTISDHYKLAWSAFAIVPVNIRSAKLFDLALRYNYQPWATPSESYRQANSRTIATNVTSFKFANQGGTMRLKLCATEQIGDSTSTTNISLCKEKVIVR